MVVGRRPRPEIAALPAAGLPSVAELFTFMRDAELRFATLRMRIEERTFGVVGEQITIVEVAVRHPNDARVMTSQPALGTTASYELWLSDGEVVRTYSAPHRLGTERPVRRGVVGISGPESRDLPGPSRVYAPLTALPTETLIAGITAKKCADLCHEHGCALAGGIVPCMHPRVATPPAYQGDRWIALTRLAAAREIAKQREALRA